MLTTPETTPAFDGSTRPSAPEPSPAPGADGTVPARQPAGSGPLWAGVAPPKTIAEYVQLVRDTRQLQRHYRKTMDPMVRREVAALEEQVDRVTNEIAAAIAISTPTPVTIPVGEGGVS